MRTYWRCLGGDLPPALRIECEAHGVFEQANGADSGAAAAHTKLTGHPTITSSAAWKVVEGLVVQ